MVYWRYSSVRRIKHRRRHVFPFPPTRQRRVNSLFLLTGFTRFIKTVDFSTLMQCISS